MAPTATEIKPLDGRTIGAMTEHGPGGKQLVQTHPAVKNISTDQSKLAFQVEWAERHLTYNRICEPGSLLFHGCNNM